MSIKGWWTPNAPTVTDAVGRVDGAHLMLMGGPGSGLTTPGPGIGAGWRWVVMHDDPESEGWIGDTNDQTLEDYLTLMRSVTEGMSTVIDPCWLNGETTTGTGPSDLGYLEISNHAVSKVFGFTRETGVLLRVHPIGPVRGNQLEVIVDAVHDLADFYAMPGTPERRLLDFFEHGTPVEPDPMNDLWQRAPTDGFGDPIYLSNPRRSDYQTQGDYARTLTGQRGGFTGWEQVTDGIFPDDMLYALYMRGDWTEHWTPEGYARIAGRFEKAFGLPLHPDDPIPITAAAARGLVL